MLKVENSSVYIEGSLVTVVTSAGQVVLKVDSADVPAVLSAHVLADYDLDETIADAIYKAQQALSRGASR